MADPTHARATWQLSVVPAGDGDWMISTYAHDDKPLAVAFCYWTGDFRIGTFGLSRTPALDRSYADLQSAQDAAQAWINELIPEAPSRTSPTYPEDDILY